MSKAKKKIGRNEQRTCALPQACSQLRNAAVTRGLQHGAGKQAAQRYTKWRVTEEEIREIRRREAKGLRDPEGKRLHEILLAIDGVGVVFPPCDPEREAIIERGQEVSGKSVRMKRGEPSRCHENSARLWSSDPQRYRVMTGYALSDDGLWRQHSWNLDPEGRPVESTVRRVAYYGVLLSDFEACAFFIQVTDGERLPKKLMPMLAGREPQARMIAAAKRLLAALEQVERRGEVRGA